MGKPGKKLKKFFLIIGTTGAVYAGLKYLLPLVAPFFIGYGAALLLLPGGQPDQQPLRLKISYKDRQYHIPVGITGGAVLLVAMSGISLLLYGGLLRLWQEGTMLMASLPIWVKEFDSWLTGWLGWMGQLLGFKENRMVDLAGVLLLELLNTVKTAAMPFLMENSMAVLEGVIRFFILCMVTFLAAVLSLQEMETLRERRDNSLFFREFKVIGSRLLQTGGAWLKSQGILWLVITAVCTAGMFFMGNPYYILAGIGIGFLDALPIFGTGTVLVPWTVFQLFCGDWKQALYLAGLYCLCYLIRQILEAHVMGGQMGLSPLETLAAVYIGLELFGFFGFILGPLGLLLVEDLVEYWEAQDIGY